MLTREHILAGFAMLEAAGIRKPEAMAVRSDKPADIAAARDAAFTAADLWAGVLADVTEADFRAALLARIRSAEVFWPTVGQILALVPERRAAALDDADEAWAKVLRIARERGRAAGAEDNRWRFDPDAGRCRAMWAGIDACDGWEALCDTAEHGYMAPRFLAAYRSNRQRRAIQAETDNVLQLADHASRGGGWKRIGGA